MPNMLDITYPDGPENWLNLDVLLTVGRHYETGQVVVTVDPGGTGIILPPHIELKEVLKQMEQPQMMFKTN